MSDDMNLQEKVDLLSAREFLGVPASNFYTGGSEHFDFLIAAGLRPHSHLVDIGCGVLRVGYWLINYLDPGAYFGIEPHQGRLAIGKETIVGPDALALKRPRFDTNAAFDTSVFGARFDYFLAYSIWSHASKRQILQMIQSFVRDAKPDALFLTSYLPAADANSDYQGDAWFGTSHESGTPGCIHHAFPWIERVCSEYGLSVSQLGTGKTYPQDWLAISREGAAVDARLQTAKAHLA